MQSVFEAERYSYIMVDHLGDLGVNVTVGHPKEVKAIVRAKIKNDKRDSHILAHLLRTDLLNHCNFPDVSSAKYAFMQVIHCRRADQRFNSFQSLFLRKVR